MNNRAERGQPCPRLRGQIKISFVRYPFTMLVLPDNITNLTPNQLTSFVHSFRMNFLIGNETIIKVIFPIRIT